MAALPRKACAAADPLGRHPRGARGLRVAGGGELASSGLGSSMVRSNRRWRGKGAARRHRDDGLGRLGRSTAAYRESIWSIQANRRSAGSASRAARALAPGCAGESVAVGGAASRFAAGAGRQILVDRLVAELGQQIEAAALGHQLGHRAVGIAEVAEMARARRAGAHAGRDAVLLGQ